MGLLYFLLGAAALAEPVPPALLQQKQWRKQPGKPILWMSSISLSPSCQSTDHYMDQYEIALQSWQLVGNRLFRPHLAVHLPKALAAGQLSQHLQMRLERFRQLGAVVIFHRLSFIDALHSTPHDLTTDVECLAGSYLRLDIAQAVSGIRGRFQEVALYTDLDIMWMRHIDQSEFDRMKPQQHFAVAYGSQLRKQEGPINIGVMLVDLQRFNALRPSLLKHGLGTRPGDTRTRMSYYLENSNDQGLLNHFFEDERPLDRAFLRDEFNYKLFWGESEKAMILHYWGVKPSTGLTCWVNQSGMSEKCPEVDGGLMPDEVMDMQQEAFDMALHVDPGLTFMKKLLSHYEQLNSTIARF